MGLTLTVLGCSGSYGRPDDACSGYLLRADGAPTLTLWLDAGPGTLANLQRWVTLADVDAVVVTHAHPDHYGDLCGLAVACRWYLDEQRMRVITTGEVQEAVRGVVSEADDVFDWEIVADGHVVEVGPATVSFNRTDHPPETLAVRVDVAGRSFGYSSDTGSAWAPTAFGPGIDLLLCEGTFTADHEDQGPHLSARQAAQGALDAGIDRMVLTHVPPTGEVDTNLAEARAIMGDGVEAAVCGRHYEI
jgi:ribonuclease BN (tRNA processing enzyme)